MLPQGVRHTRWDLETNQTVHRERLAAEEALHHQFLSWSKRRSAGPSLQKRRLLSYVYRRRWKRAVNTLLACHRLRNSVTNTPATSTDGTDSDGSK